MVGKSITRVHTIITSSQGFSLTLAGTQSTTGSQPNLPSTLLQSPFCGRNFTSQCSYKYSLHQYRIFPSLVAGLQGHPILPLPQSLSWHRNSLAYTNTLPWKPNPQPTVTQNACQTDGLHAHLPQVATGSMHAKAPLHTRMHSS